jgi:biopolymer transport protein ExbD
MARNRVPAEPDREELPLTPMIDVIFQLLVFFMCAAHFKQIEGKLDSYMPNGPGPAIDEPFLEARLRLVPEDGTVAAYLERRPLGTFPSDPARLEGVSARWDRVGLEAAAVWKDAVRRDPRAVVKLDVDPKVPFQYAVSALDACRRAGVTQVDFAASPRIHETLRDD